MNIEALKNSLKEVLKSCMVLSETEEGIYKFLESGDFNVFSKAAKKELSTLYANIILPAYKFYSKGDFIPNIFVSYDDEEEEDYANQVG